MGCPDDVCLSTTMILQELSFLNFVPHFAGLTDSILTFLNDVVP